jgi:hypothetical protein
MRRAVSPCTLQDEKWQTLTVCCAWKKSANGPLQQSTEALAVPLGQAGRQAGRPLCRALPPVGSIAVALRQ